MLENVAAVLPAVDPQLMLLGLVGGAVLLLAIGVAGFFGPGDVIEERLADGSRSTGIEGGAAGLRRHQEHDRLKRFKHLLTPKDAASRSSLSDRLVRAGYRGEGAARTYTLTRAVLGLSGAVIVALLLPLLSSSADPREILIFTVGAAGLGYAVPSYWIARRIQIREEAIRHGFPDTLDMLLVCVEAGQALDMALGRVAQEVTQAHPILAEELMLVSYELRAGKERSEVLRDFSRRAGVDDVSAFVTVLIQSDQFGTSIGDSLRVYASEMRLKRLMRAEEKANKLPVKLALGTMAFTVPPVLLILVGPSIIMVMRSFVRFFG